MDCWYFTDIDFTDVQQASVSPPCLSLYHFLYGRHMWKLSWKKKGIWWPASSRVRTSEAACERPRGNLLNSVEPYRRFLQKEENHRSSAPSLPAVTHLQLNYHQALQLSHTHHKDAGTDSALTKKPDWFATISRSRIPALACDTVGIRVQRKHTHKKKS